MVENPVERGRLPAPPGRDGRKFQFLSSQVSGKAREERHNSGGLNEATAQCICNLYISSNDCIHQARHAEQGIAPQLERVAKAIVHPAQDYMDLLQSIDGLEKYAAVAHRQIGSLNQSKSKVPRHIRMFEVGLVERTGGQDHDARVVALGQGSKCFALGTKKRSET